LLLRRNCVEQASTLGSIIGKSPRATTLSRRSTKVSTSAIAALVFLSNESLGGVWHQEEITVLKSDLQRALEQGEAAQQFYEKALAIAERLVAQEPGRADYQIDLAKSLVRAGDPSNLQRSLDILTRMRNANQLMPTDAALIDLVREMLQRAKAAGAT
jgi:hypothetical protein